MKDLQKVLNQKRAQCLELRRQVDALQAASHALRAVDYLLADDDPAESILADALPEIGDLCVIEPNSVGPEEVAPRPPSPQSETLDRVEDPQQRAS